MRLKRCTLPCRRECVCWTLFTALTSCVSVPGSVSLNRATTKKKLKLQTPLLHHIPELAHYKQNRAHGRTPTAERDGGVRSPGYFAVQVHPPTTTSYSGTGGARATASTANNGDENAMQHGVGSLRVCATHTAARLAAFCVVFPLALGLLESRSGPVTSIRSICNYQINRNLYIVKAVRTLKRNVQ